MAAPNPGCPAFKTWRGVSARNSQRAQEDAKTPVFATLCSIYVPTDLRGLLEPRPRSFGLRDLESAVVAIKANDKLQWLGAVIAVRKGLSYGFEPPPDNVLAAAAAALPRMVLFMGVWDTPKLQLEATRAVALLVWSGGARLCAAVVAAGALDAAVALLQPEEDEASEPDEATELREEAARLLGNVASYGVGPRDACLQAGVLPALLSAAARCLTPPVQRLAPGSSGTPLSPSSAMQQQQQLQQAYPATVRPLSALALQQQQQDQKTRAQQATSPPPPPPAPLLLPRLLVNQLQQQLLPPSRPLSASYQQQHQQPQQAAARAPSPLLLVSPPPSPLTSPTSPTPAALLQQQQRPYLTSPSSPLSPPPSPLALPWHHRHYHYQQQQQRQQQQQQQARPFSAVVHPTTSRASTPLPVPSPPPPSPAPPRGPPPVRQLARLALMLLASKPRDCSVSRELLPSLSQLLLRAAPHCHRRQCRHRHHHGIAAAAGAGAVGRRTAAGGAAAGGGDGCNGGSCGDDDADGDDGDKALEPAPKEGVDAAGDAGFSLHGQPEQQQQQGTWRRQRPRRLQGITDGTRRPLCCASSSSSSCCGACCDLMAALALAAEDCPEGVVAEGVPEGVVAAAAKTLALFSRSLGDLFSSSSSSSSDTAGGVAHQGSAIGSSTGGGSSASSSMSGMAGMGCSGSGGDNNSYCGLPRGASSDGSIASYGEGSRSSSISGGGGGGAGVGGTAIGEEGEARCCHVGWELPQRAAHLLSTLCETGGQKLVQAVLGAGALQGAFRPLMMQQLLLPVLQVGSLGCEEEEQQQGQQAQQRQGQGQQDRSQQQLGRQPASPGCEGGDEREAEGAAEEVVLEGVEAVVLEVCAAAGNIAAHGLLAQAAALVHADLLRPLVRLMLPPPPPGGSGGSAGGAGGSSRGSGGSDTEERQPQPLEVRRCAALALSYLAVKDVSLAQAVFSAGAAVPLSALVAELGGSCGGPDMRAVVAAAEALLAMAQAGAPCSSTPSGSRNSSNAGSWEGHRVGGSYGGGGDDDEDEDDDEDDDDAELNPVLMSYIDGGGSGAAGGGVYDNLKLALARGMLPRAAVKVELLMTWLPRRTAGVR